jgi:hypothetical protein
LFGFSVEFSRFILWAIRFNLTDYARTIQIFLRTWGITRSQAAAHPQTHPDNPDFDNLRLGHGYLLTPHNKYILEQSYSPGKSKG